VNIASPASAAVATPSGALLADPFTFGGRRKHMRKYSIVVALVVVSVAVWTSSSPAISSPQVFSLLEVSTPNGDQQIGDFTFNRPPIGGDQVGFTNALYKWAGNKKGVRAGRDQGLITFMTGFGPDFSRKATALFVVQIYLQGGTVLIQGYGQINPNGPSKYTFPVVGGTGKYDNVRGYLYVRDLGNGNQDKTNLEFHLLP
jgi:hypothetical protein